MTTLVCSWFKNKTIRSNLAPRRRSFCQCIFHSVVWWAVCTPSSCPMVEVVVKIWSALFSLSIQKGQKSRHPETWYSPWSERTYWGPWLWTPREGSTWTHSSPPTWCIPQVFMIKNVEQYLTSWHPISTCSWEGLSLLQWTTTSTRSRCSRTGTTLSCRCSRPADQTLWKLSWFKKLIRNL